MPGVGIIERAQDILHRALGAVGVQAFESRRTVGRFALKNHRVGAEPCPRLWSARSCHGQRTDHLPSSGSMHSPSKPASLNNATASSVCSAPLNRAHHGFSFAGRPRFAVCGICKSEPAFGLVPAHFGNVARDFPGVTVRRSCGSTG